jgi:hypothetical protein
MSNIEPERPRAEPEIIPPDRIAEDELRRAARIHMDDGAGGFQRIYIARIGPFGTILLALASGAIAILLLALLVGAFLIWIPIVGLLVAAAVISTLLRNFFQRR